MCTIVSSPMECNVMKLQFAHNKRHKTPLHKIYPNVLYSFFLSFSLLEAQAMGCMRDKGIYGKEKYFNGNEQLHQRSLNEEKR